MAIWTPARADTLEALAREILHNYSRGRALVAVDGVAAAGTERFADDLAGALGALGSHVVRASMSGFVRPAPERHAHGSDSSEGLYRESFDYEEFRRALANPFRSGEHQEQAQPVPADAILLVDGVFLNRPELAGLWNYSIWLDSAPGHPVDGAGPVDDPDGSVHAISRDRAAHALYEAEAQPRGAAVAIIDNTDVEHPRRVFADAC